MDDSQFGNTLDCSAFTESVDLLDPRSSRSGNVTCATSASVDFTTPTFLRPHDAFSQRTRLSSGYSFSQEYRPGPLQSPAVLNQAAIHPAVANNTSLFSDETLLAMVSSQEMVFSQRPDDSSQIRSNLSAAESQTSPPFSLTLPDNRSVSDSLDKVDSHNSPRDDTCVSADLIECDSAESHNRCIDRSALSLNAVSASAENKPPSSGVEPATNCAEMPPNAEASLASNADRDHDSNDQQDSPAGHENLSLDCWQLDECVLANYHSVGVRSLFRWQRECLSLSGVATGRNLVYSAPTSAGKTLVAEILMLRRVMAHGKKAIIVLPFVALAREKMHSLKRLCANTAVRVDGFHGNYSPQGGLNNVDIAVCTVEKANSLINRLLEEDNLSCLTCVVVDELHLVGDKHRGFLIEILLTKLLYFNSAMSCGGTEYVSGAECERREDESGGIQLIGMSATLPNMSSLSDWLSAALYTTDFRPVPLTRRLKIGPTIFSENMRPLRTMAQLLPIERDPDHVIELCVETVAGGHGVLVFCPAKDWCEKLAVSVAAAFRDIGDPGGSCERVGWKQAANGLRQRLSAPLLSRVLQDLGATSAGRDRSLASSVCFGVAFHHAGLTVEERDIIEAAFRAATLCVLVATSTLSSGVNLPARRVIIRSPLQAGTMIDSLAYHQMAGRAGRSGIDTQGECILISRACDGEAASRLITSPLPAVTSCLTSSGQSPTEGLKRAVLEMVACGVLSTRQRVEAFVSCAMNVASAQLTSQCVDWLLKHLLIRAEQDGTIHATQLGSAGLASSLGPADCLSVLQELERARQCFALDSDLHLIYLMTPVYSGDLWARLDWLNYLQLFDQLSESSCRVAQLVGVTPQFIMRALRSTLNRQNAEQMALLAVHKRFLTALALYELVLETPLSTVTAKYGCNRGALQSLQLAAATFAGMVGVFCGRLGWRRLQLLLVDLQPRLEYGVPAELSQLVRISVVDGGRARALHAAGLQLPAQLATSCPQLVVRALRHSIPFSTDGSRDSDVIYVEGTRRLTLAEAADIIIKQSRLIVQTDLGLANVDWTRNNPTTGTSCDLEKGQVNDPERSDCASQRRVSSSIHSSVVGGGRNGVSMTDNVGVVDSGGSEPQGSSEVSAHDISVVSSRDIGSSAVPSGTRVMPRVEVSSSEGAALGSQSCVDSSPLPPLRLSSASVSCLDESGAVSPSAGGTGDSSRMSGGDLFDSYYSFNDDVTVAETASGEGSRVVNPGREGDDECFNSSECDNRLARTPDASGTGRLRTGAGLSTTRRGSLFYACQRESLGLNLAGSELKLSRVGETAMEASGGGWRQRKCSLGGQCLSSSFSTPAVFGHSCSDSVLDEAFSVEQLDLSDLLESAGKSSPAGNSESKGDLSEAAADTSFSEVSTVKTIPKFTSGGEGHSTVVAHATSVKQSAYQGSSRLTEASAPADLPPARGVPEKPDPQCARSDPQERSNTCRRLRETTVRKRLLRSHSRHGRDKRHLPFCHAEDSVEPNSSHSRVVLDVDDQEKKERVKNHTDANYQISSCAASKRFRLSRENDTREPVVAPPKTLSRVAPRTPSKASTNTPSKPPPKTPLDMPPKTPPNLLPKTPPKLPTKTLPKLLLKTPPKLPPKTPSKPPLKTPPKIPLLVPSPMPRSSPLGCAGGQEAEMSVVRLSSDCSDYQLQLNKLISCRRLLLCPVIDSYPAESSSGNSDGGVSLLNGSRMVGVVVSSHPCLSYLVQLDTAAFTHEFMSWLSWRLQCGALSVCMLAVRQWLWRVLARLSCWPRCRLEDPTVADWMLRSQPAAAAVSGSSSVNSTLKQLSRHYALADKSVSQSTASRNAHQAALASTRLTHSLASALHTRLKQNNMWNAYVDVEMAHVYPLLEMETSGLCVDSLELDRQVALIRRHISVIQQYVDAVAKRHVNLSSPKDVKKLLFVNLAVTSSAAACMTAVTGTDRNSLLKIRHCHPAVDAVIAWRKLSHILHQLAMPMQRAVTRCSHEVCRVKPSWHTESSTGRLTANRPNVQCVPRAFPTPHLAVPPTDALHLGDDNHKQMIELRRALTAAPGHVLLSADYCQLELRVLAHLSEDVHLMDIVRNSGDAFTNIAAHWDNIDVCQVSVEQRERAKTLSYAIIYGMSDRSLSDHLHVTESEAHLFQQQFFSRFPGVRAYLNSVLDECRRVGFVSTLMNRRRPLPDIKAANHTRRARAERCAVNSTIQGSAADLMKVATSAIYTQLNQKFGYPPRDACGCESTRPLLVLQLHDELMFEVIESEVDHLASVVRACMCDALPLRVPLQVRLKSGANWHDMLPL